MMQRELTGPELRQAFLVAFDRLEEYRDTVNALNVFPVPDGDTGTNMSLTLRSGVERCPGDDSVTAGQVASELAQGTFFGARGNSGVILSQFFKGFSDALQGRNTCGASDLAQALDMARVAAYGAVGSPKEGTMLTVIRKAAEAALGAVGSDDLAGVLETAFEASCVALKNTPEQLPVLKEAGVVDSGGLGVVVILGGTLESLAPERLQAVSQDTGLESIIDSSMASLGGSAQAQDQGFVHASMELDWGYCTEFIINGQRLDLDTVRGDLQKIALSTAVVGDSQHLRVHIHAEDPGPALSYGVSLGSLSNIKIDNMDQQNLDLASRPGAKKLDTAVLAVAAGHGIGDLFRSSGCAAVVEGGQTMNPSVAQILEAADRANANHVIVLPNNGNIVLTARQAAQQNPALHVVPSSTIPQGVTALLAYNPEQPLEANLEAMEQSLAEVASVAVTWAVRDTTIDGITVDAGAFIGLLEDELAATGPSAEAALRATLDLASMDTGSIVTLYLGADADPEAAKTFIESLEAEFPGIQVDRVEGGQPHYPYFASVE
jgi:DAK2 domain fusion protein YloV